MVFTRRPLEEKMTYFWNGHFTSGIAKVQGVTLMLNQNKTQRQYALGKFDDLVVKISQDPAMLVWLDNATSRAGRPNENYARELMELFTLGVDEYTQADVSDLARALTGWTVQGYTGADNYNGARFLDNPAFHDNGVKTILGQTGNWNGYDAIRILLEASDEQGSVSGRFLSRKLRTYFAYHDPPDWVGQEQASMPSGRSPTSSLPHARVLRGHARSVRSRSSTPRRSCGSSRRRPTCPPPSTASSRWGSLSSTRTTPRAPKATWTGSTPGPSSPAPRCRTRS
jgi:hypothetical protein